MLGVLVWRDRLWKGGLRMGYQQISILVAWRETKCSQLAPGAVHCSCYLMLLLLVLPPLVVIIFF